MVSLSWLRRKNIEEEIPQKGVLSRKSLWEKMQCTAEADAVHCKDGCSALRERLQCTASEIGKRGPKSPVLFWMGKWKEMMLLYDEFHLHSLKSSGTQILLTVVQEKALCRIERISGEQNLIDTRVRFLHLFNS